MDDDQNPTNKTEKKLIYFCKNFTREELHPSVPFSGGNQKHPSIPFIYRDPDPMRHGEGALGGGGLFFFLRVPRPSGPRPVPAQKTENRPSDRWRGHGCRPKFEDPPQ